jgi:hypothetical protein
MGKGADQDLSAEEVLRKKEKKERKEKKRERRELKEEKAKSGESEGTSERKKEKKDKQTKDRKESKEASPILEDAQQRTAATTDSPSSAKRHRAVDQETERPLKPQKTQVTDTPSSVTAPKGKPVPKPTPANMSAQEKRKLLWGNKVISSDHPLHP